MESGAYEAESTNREPRFRLEPVSREISPSPGDCEDILDPMQMVHVKMELPDREDAEATADPGYPHSGSGLRFAATVDEENTRIELAEGRRTFCCLQCDYKTTHRWSQRKHLIVHSKKKPFKCNLCEYTCVRLAGLKRHTKVHTGDRPYSCTVCDYTCSEKSTLLQHMAMHTGIKPYRCQLCSYRCSRSGHLTQHMAKHSGLKPHKCKLCSASFGLRGNLYQHLDRMHDGRRPTR